MVHVKMSAVLPAPAKRYFIERDSAAFRSLEAKMLKIGTLSFRDCWKEGDTLFVTLVTKPDFGSWVPKSVAKLIHFDEIEFVDTIAYNPEHARAPPYKLFVTSHAPILGKKFKSETVLTIEEVDAHSCRQTLEGEINVKVLGVGRVAEGIIKDSLQNTYKALPEVVRRWEALRAELLEKAGPEAMLSGRPPLDLAWISEETRETVRAPLTSSISSATSEREAGTDTAMGSYIVQRTQQDINSNTSRSGPGTVSGSGSQTRQRTQQGIDSSSSSIRADSSAERPLVAGEEAAGQLAEPERLASSLPSSTMQGGSQTMQGGSQTGRYTGAAATDRVDCARSEDSDDDSVVFHDALERISGPPKEDCAVADAQEDQVWAGLDPTTRSILHLDRASLQAEVDGAPPGRSESLELHVADAAGKLAHDSAGVEGGPSGYISDVGEDAPYTRATKAHWQRFNSQYAVWGRVWDGAGVAVHEGAHLPTRIVHLLDLGIRWGVLKVVQVSHIGSSDKPGASDRRVDSDRHAAMASGADSMDGNTAHSTLASSDASPFKQDAAGAGDKVGARRLCFCITRRRRARDQVFV